MPAIGCDSDLTNYRDFKQGSLKHLHLTRKIFCYMKALNKSISSSLDKSGLSGNAFWDALDNLEQCDIPLLGCVDHTSVYV